MPDRIYFDHSATTPMDSRVANAMLPCLGALYGNPSSLYEAGRKAHSAVEEARRQVADLFHARADEIIFTSSGTEANNLALTGFVEAREQKNIHLVTSAIEHPSILKTCRYLESRGVAVTYLPVSSEGIVEPKVLEAAIRSETRLVSIMTANNVIGTIQPIKELGKIAHRHGVVFHTDAVQAFGKLQIDTRDQAADLISVSAHKLYGPKGIGALYVRKGIPINPILHGGGQERGLRSATENVPGIMGFGRAAQIAQEEMPHDAAKLVEWRETMLDYVLNKIPGAYLIGHPYARLPGHLCLGFSGLEGDTIKLMMLLDEAGVAVSTGSACSAHQKAEASYILQALGFDPLKARGALRVTLGRFNSKEEVERFLEILPKAVSKLQPMSTRLVANTQN
ncbi:MAG: cysteine desulfurase family protein [Candidatus Omnitrophota bacterium]